MKKNKIKIYKISAPCQSCGKEQNFRIGYDTELDKWLFTNKCESCGYHNSHDHLFDELDLSYNSKKGEQK